MKKILTVLLRTLCLITAGLLLHSCKKSFLNYTPQGVLSQNTLATEAGVDGLLIGAYAALTGQGPYGASITGGDCQATPPDNWVWGSEFGLEAQSNPAGWIISPTNTMFDDKWKADYEGISRCNNTIVVAKEVPSLAASDLNNILGQARFLRAYYYFDLVKMFNMVPWIDETTTNFNQPNNKSIWPYIESDLEFAFANMPASQSDPGRANTWSAAALLGKAYLYQHQYDSAKMYFDQVIQSGKTASGVAFGLDSIYDDNFQPQFELGNPETVFAVDMAANVGNGSIQTANQGDMQNYPIGAPFNCCSNFQPTIDFANAFSTDANGLPYLTDYENHPISTDLGIMYTQPFTPYTGTVDPRLDWSAGRRGIPYLDWGLMPGSDWMYNQANSGPYVSKKRVYWQATASQYYDGESWAPGSAINYAIIRFADVLLMDAECDAQLSSLDQAETYVNMVRNRAANPAGWVYQYAATTDLAPPSTTALSGGFSTTPAANYLINPYPPGSFSANGQAYALSAIYFERRLELGEEGHRFFDLVRWGLADQVLPGLYTYMDSQVNELVGATFTPNKNEYFPIPQAEIDNTTVNGVATLKQNPGY